MFAFLWRISFLTHLLSLFQSSTHILQITIFHILLHSYSIQYLYHPDQVDTAAQSFNLPILITHIQGSGSIVFLHIHINGTMPQAGIDPSAQSHASYKGSVLPPSHRGWMSTTKFTTKSAFLVSATSFILLFFFHAYFEASTKRETAMHG